MALTEDDLKAMRLLMREEIHDAFEQRFEPFRRDVDGRFEGLYAQNAKREQEYLFIKEQLKRQDEQLTEISKELGRHTQYFDDVDKRITVLEKKIA